MDRVGRTQVVAGRYAGHNGMPASEVLLRVDRLAPVAEHPVAVTLLVVDDAQRALVQAQDRADDGFFRGFGKQDVTFAGLKLRHSFNAQGLFAQLASEELQGKRRPRVAFHGLVNGESDFGTEGLGPGRGSPEAGNALDRGVRDDGGVYQGAEVSIYYDPMISKFAVWGRDRAEAIDRMRRALLEYEVGGIKNLKMLVDLLAE